MKKVFFLSLAFAVLALILYSAFTKGNEVRQNNEYEKQKSQIVNAEIQLRTQAVYFNRLSSAEQYLYDKIAQAAYKLDEYTEKMAYVPSLTEINNAVQALVLDDPSLFYIDIDGFSLDDIVIEVADNKTVESETQAPEKETNRYNADDPPDIPHIRDSDEVTENVQTETERERVTEIIKQVENEKYTSLRVPYSDDTETIVLKKKRLEMALSKADMLVGECDDEYSKALVLHDYVCEISKKSSAAQYCSRSYGVLVECAGDSKGYALAYKLLLNRYGIISYIADGKSSGTTSSWNVVLLDGKFYNADAYADDGGERAGHAYFALCDDDLSKTHSVDDDSLPSCTENTDYYEKYSLLCMSEDVVKNVVKANVSEGKMLIEIKTTYSTNTDRISELAKSVRTDIDAEAYELIPNTGCYLITIRKLESQTTECGESETVEADDTNE